MFWLVQHASAVITPALVGMLVGVFLHIPLRDFTGVRNMRFTGVNLALNFVWTPLFAWTFGAIVLRATGAGPAVLTAEPLSLLA